MSTNQQRLKAAIRRIAKSDPEIRSLLRTLEARGGIPRSGASASNDSERDRTCCDGSTPDGGGGSGGSGTVGTDTQNPSEGGQDGLNPDDPADLGDVGPGELSGLVDCETGTPVCFEGSNFEPPEGWDSPTDYDDPSLRDGVWYEFNYTPENYDCSDKTFRAFTVNGICQQFFAYFVTCRTPDEDATIKESVSVRDPNTSATLGDCTYIERPNDPPPYSRNFTITIHKTTQRYCTTSPEFCEENSPDDEPAMKWPYDGCVSLTSKDGALVGSKRDPENDGSYSAPRDEIELCDEEGGQVNIKPSGSTAGGWKSINPAVDGGDGYLYDGSGKQIARISGSEYSDPNI